jgi:hypothetical protein
VLAFGDADIEQLVTEDEAVAEEIDRERLAHVHTIVEAAIVEA